MTFIERVESKQIGICVIGLGYVGLPLAVAFARAGFSVCGYDSNDEKVASMVQGDSGLEHFKFDEYKDLLGKNLSLFNPASFPIRSKYDVLIICVPTPLTKNRDPELKYVEAAAMFAGAHLKKGGAVILESTTYPGTTFERVKPVVEITSRFKAGIDFSLGYSPERQDPGNQHFDTVNIPKVVGGMTSECKENISALYRSALEKVIPVSSLEVAEMVKLLENIYRFVNIALVNELKLLCDKMDIDIWEVVEAASTKPFGFQSFKPGPGASGHCLALDPFYLTWRAKRVGMSTKFIEMAGEINNYMPYYAIEKLRDALDRQGKSLNGATIFILGIAYKKNIGDTRESPFFKIANILKDKNVSIIWNDPFVSLLHLDLANVHPCSLENGLEQSDVTLILTDHDNVDYDLVLEKSKAIVDTRNVFKGNNNKVIKA